MELIALEKRSYSLAPIVGAEFIPRTCASIVRALKSAPTGVIRLEPD